MTVLTFVLTALIMVVLVASALAVGWQITRHQRPDSIIIRACWGVLIGATVLVVMVALWAAGSVAAQAILQASTLALCLSGLALVLTVAIRKRIEGYDAHPWMIFVVSVLVGLFGSAGVYYLVGELPQDLTDSTRYLGIYTVVTDSFWSGAGAAGMFLLGVLIVGCIWAVRSLRRGHYDHPLIETIAFEREEIRQLLRSR